MITKRAFINTPQLIFSANQYDQPDGQGLQKHASLAPDASKYVNKAQQENPNKVILVVNGLGSGDYYGCNINGDYFPEDALTGKQTEQEAVKNPGPAKGEKLIRYKTFNNGHVFKQHNNDDPKESIGEVLDSFWNDIMHRVELVLGVEKDNAEKILKKQRKGKPVPVSMGCKVPQDYCSVCNNAAKTRSEYCKHLKNKIGDILPNGKQVFAINRQPRFFDISFVTVPADRTAYALKIITPEGTEEVISSEDDSEGEDQSPKEEFIEAFSRVANANEKTASVDDKDASIDKEVPAEDNPENKAEGNKKDKQPEECDNGTDENNLIRLYIKEGSKDALQEIQKRTIGNLIGKQAASKLEKHNAYLEPDGLEDIDMSKISNLEFNQLEEEKIAEVLDSKLEDQNPFGQISKESQRQIAPKRGRNRTIKPQPARITDLDKLEGQSDEIANRGLLGLGGAVGVTALLRKLRKNRDQAKSIINKHPELAALLLGVTSAGAAAASAPDRLEAGAGKRYVQTVNS